MKVTPTFLYPIFGLETTTIRPGCGLGIKLRQHNFVVVPRFTTRDVIVTLAVTKWTKTAATEFKRTETLSKCLPNIIQREKS